MIFAHPLVLTLLAAPIALAIWEWTRTGSRVRMPFDHARAPRRRFVGFTLKCAQLLPPVMLAVGLALLAGPRRPSPPAEERMLTNIEFCLDVSGSMSSPVGNMTRHEAAMQAIQGFTTGREGDAFGLTIFGGEVMRWVPLTTDLSAIRNATPLVDPTKLPPHFGSTRIAAAMRFCRDTLSQTEEGDRMVILVSDGLSSDLYGGSAAQLGAELADADVAAYAIHIGLSAPPAELYDIVRPTGGEVFAASDQAGLGRVFDRIDEMKPIRLKPSQPEPVDHFAPFAIAGLAALGLYASTLLGWRHTPW